MKRRTFLAGLLGLAAAPALPAVAARAVPNFTGQLGTLRGLVVITNPPSSHFWYRLYMGARGGGKSEFLLRE